MSKKRILCFIGIAFAVIGLVCLGLCIFCEGNNPLLFILGIMCNSIAFFISCIARNKKK